MNEELSNTSSEDKIDIPKKVLPHTPLHDTDRIFSSWTSADIGTNLERVEELTTHTPWHHNVDAAYMGSMGGNSFATNEWTHTGMSLLRSKSTIGNSSTRYGQTLCMNNTPKTIKTRIQKRKHLTKTLRNFQNNSLYDNLPCTSTYTGTNFEPAQDTPWYDNMDAAWINWVTPFSPDETLINNGTNSEPVQELITGTHSYHNMDAGWMTSITPLTSEEALTDTGTNVTYPVEEPISDMPWYENGVMKGLRAHSVCHPSAFKSIINTSMNAAHMSWVNNSPPATDDPCICVNGPSCCMSTTPEVVVSKKQEEEKFENQLKKNMTCPICLDTLCNHISSTTCGHVFCTECIKHAVKLFRSCPICRKHLKKKHIRRLFI